ncbi:hypothetical protein QYE76_044248 [Lolium multiflorum]|uniref:Uncharacterized protein n=1 Tax=Lolium multiflorum TaxID=4521 RepID=A0AAD8WWK2_LOLMU|nr:hypothetical protein QYE76_044248 [Lolium multiflorum]
MSKHDEKKARSLGLIPAEEGNVILPVFLKRRIHPVMSRAHQMWLYSGSRDETRVNVTELSEKELLDEVRHLTHFSQEDSIPLLALHEPYDLDHQPSEIPPTAEYFPIASEDEENPKEGGSTANIESCAEIGKDSEVPKGEDNDPANPKASSADHRILDDGLTDTAESNHENDANRVSFVHAALEKSTAQPPKRPAGGFADEDDLILICFIEPPSKKAKASPSRPTLAASEASAPPIVPSAPSSLSKGKEVPSAAAASPSPHGEPGIQTAIIILKDFASQFCSPQADNARLQEDIQSTTSKLDQAVNIAATARQNADSLKKELDQLKKKLKEEEKEQAEAQAQRKEREDLLHKSSMALLEAADIPFNFVGKLQADSFADAISLAMESSPSSSPEEQGGPVELLMGHEFKAEMELLTKELPKDQDGLAIDLSPFKASACKCMLQLLELAAGVASPSLSTQTQAP